jgi:hypothetical protein
MKYKKKDIVSACSCQPRIRFEEQDLTSFAGILLFQQLFQSLGLKKRLKKCFGHLKRSSMYGFQTISLALVVHLLLGWKRLRDFEYYTKDPVVCRVVGLKRLPTFSTVSRFLRRIDDKAAKQVGDLVTGVVGERLAIEQLATVTLDFDGSVLSTRGRNIEGTAVGFNKKHKGDRSYYPFFCTIPQLGEVWRAWQRSGNVHDSNGAHQWVAQTVSEVRQVSPKSRVEVRLDSAHYNDDTISVLSKEAVEFSASVPFERFTELKRMIEHRCRWRFIDSEWAFFEARWKPKCWSRKVRILLYRRKVRKPRKGPIQLHLFQPVEFDFEYKVVATNKKISPRGILLFHNGRGSQEGLFAELKTQCQMGYIPTKRKAGNTAWLHFACLAHNLTRELQMRVQTRSRVNTAKRAALYAFEQLHSLRRRFLQRAGRLTRPQGILTLTISASERVGKEFMDLLSKLAA